jgi:hypothetical protein
MRYKKVSRPDSSLLYVTDQGEIALAVANERGYSITFYDIPLTECDKEDPYAKINTCLDTMTLYANVDNNVLDDYVLSSISKSYWTTSWSQNIVEDPSLFSDYKL